MNLAIQLSNLSKQKLTKLQGELTNQPSVYKNTSPSNYQNKQANKSVMVQKI